MARFLRLEIAVWKVPSLIGSAVTVSFVGVLVSHLRLMSFRGTVGDLGHHSWVQSSQYLSTTRPRSFHTGSLQVRHMHLGSSFEEQLIWDSHVIRFDRMDFWVWTNRFSGTASDHWRTGRKSGYLDSTPVVSAFHPYAIFWMTASVSRLIGMTSLMLLIWFLVPGVPKRDE